MKLKNAIATVSVAAVSLGLPVALLSSNSASAKPAPKKAVAVKVSNAPVAEWAQSGMRIRCNDAMPWNAIRGIEYQDRFVVVVRCSAAFRDQVEKINAKSNG